MSRETTVHVPQIREKARIWMEDGCSGEVYCKVCGRRIQAPAVDILGERQL